MAVIEVPTEHTSNTHATCANCFISKRDRKVVATKAEYYRLAMPRRCCVCGVVVVHYYRGYLEGQVNGELKCGYNSYGVRT